MNFEQALARLETITQTMQQNQPLDQALAMYREGNELVQFCQTKLAEMEQQLHVLDQNQLKELELNDL